MATKNEVNINIGDVYISVATEHDYPDVIADLIARARELTRNVLGDIRELGVLAEDFTEDIIVGADDDDDDELAE